MINMEMQQNSEKESEFKQFERAITAASPYVEQLKSLISDIEKSTDLNEDEKGRLLYSIRVLIGGEGYYTKNLPSTFGNKEGEKGLDLGEEYGKIFKSIIKANNIAEYQELDKKIEASETLNVREKNILRGTIYSILN